MSEKETSVYSHTVKKYINIYMWDWLWMVMKGKWAMAWKVTEQGEWWEVYVSITGLVRGKTVKKNSCNGFYVFLPF